MDIYYFILYFFTYGFLGWCTEVAYAAVKQGTFVNRGFLSGPICPIYGVGVGLVVQFLMPVKDNLLLLYVMATILVTVIEGLTGFFMDKIFHHKWWDYSEQPLNIGGYVCAVFSLIWGVACVLIVRIVHPLIHHVLSWIPFVVGVVAAAVIFSAVLCVDLYMTASGIFKLNKRLEALEKVVDELKEVSERVGSNIYENVMETMDKVQEITTEQKQRITELKKKYRDIAGQKTRISERLMKAFPKMESRKHKDIMEQLKRAVKNRPHF